MLQGVAAIQIGPATLHAVCDCCVGDEVDLFIRAQDVAISRTVSPGSVQNHLSALVSEIMPEGVVSRVLLDCGFPLTALITNRAREDLGLVKGDRVLASVKAAAIHVVPRSRVE
jgi:molybdopterin-binding protein